MTDVETKPVEAPSNLNGEGLALGKSENGDSVSRKPPNSGQAENAGVEQEPRTVPETATGKIPKADPDPPLQKGELHKKALRPQDAVGQPTNGVKSVEDSEQKVGELEQHKATEDAETPKDPAKYIEAHILPRLDPAFVDYFINVALKNPFAQDVTIKDIRAHPEKYRNAMAIDTSGEPRVADHQVTSADGDTVTVRVYHPDPERHGPGPYPVHLNYHGGGFVLGDLWGEGQICMSMREAGVAVIDVNYRHCPEYVFGKCIEDAWAALNWAHDSASALNINPTSISIGGISAGGHIVFVLQHMARDAGLPLKLCMASVPAATDAGSYEFYTDSPFASFREFYKAPILPWARIAWFGAHCLPRERIPEIRALWPDFWLAPMRATNWRGLCDTFIRTAEIDPLRDEGEAYGMKLVAGGNKVVIKRYLGCPHTFMSMKFLQQKKDYDADAIAALKEAHGLRS